MPPYLHAFALLCAIAQGLTILCLIAEEWSINIQMIRE